MTPASEMMAKSSSPRRSRRGVRARAIGGETRGARGSGLGARARLARAPIPRSRAPVMLRGYASFTRPRDHPQCAAAQSQGDHRRAAAVRPLGRHRTVGVRQELAGVRYPLRRGPTPLHRVALDICQAVPRAAGFVRAQLGGVLARLDPPDAEQRVREAQEVLVVVDRLPASDATRGRLADAVATAFNEGEGVAVALDNGDRRRFSAHPTCSNCGTAAPALTPILFSFNNPRGACPGCNGFGAVLEYDESLIVPQPRKSLAQGALDPWTKPRYEGRRRILRETARAKGIPLDAPWEDLTGKARHFLLNGASGRFLGMLPFLQRLEAKRYKQYIRVFLRQYQLAKVCPACGGARLKPEALAVRVGGRTIADVAALSAGALRDWIGALELTPFQRSVAVHILAELAARVSFVNDVGLGYLTLDRLTRTLSGGEAQRIALSNALGSHLVDTLYVLDEPTIGLHPADTGRLLGLLRRLADGGNTVVVVEHDPAAMRAADWMVGEVRALDGWQAISDVVLVDQAPIGRTPRSNPITYIKAFDELRALFAAEPLARARAYTPSTFSFNVAGGRCDACEGAGHVLVEMVFLANVFVPCEVCAGKRFKKQVLEVKLGGSSIHDVLEWTVDQALRRFHRQPRLARALWHLQQVGLGYLRLGQPATTLSGGEAQRLKIARELALAGGKTRAGRKLYILDEPTTGLHLDDVRTLCRVLDRLVDAGHTVLVIEHHLDVVKRADWVIERGPGAGDAGGRVVAQGTPEDVARVAASATGRYLRDLA